MKAGGAIRGEDARKFAERAKRKSFVSMIKPNLIPVLKPNKKMKVVDFCTGSGNIIPFFKDNVGEFITIDDSEEMINMLKEDYGNINNLKILKANVSDTGLESDEYDAVIIKFSLHHIYNAFPMFKEAYRILKKGGKFFIIDFVFEGNFIDGVKLFFVRIKKTIKQGYHELFCKYRDHGMIKELAKRSKFKIIKEEFLAESKKHDFFKDYMYVLEK